MNGPNESQAANQQDDFKRAIELHREGDLPQAERIYADVLRRQPAHSDALHLLGLVAIQTGRAARGVDLIRQSIELNPKFASAHSNLSAALNELGRYEEGLASADRALALTSDAAEALSNRAGALNGLKRHEEALASCDRAIALRPASPEAYNNRGNALKELKRLDEALASYDKAIELKPGHAEAYANRGGILHELGRYDEALASCDRAVEFKPKLAVAHIGRGRALQELRRLDESLASQDKAVAIAPASAEAHFNRGNALREMRRFSDALASYDKAISLDAEFAGAYSNRANVLCQLGLTNAAIASSEKAIALKPDAAEMHVNHGIYLLTAGRYEEGLPEYEWRYRMPELRMKRSYAQPQWLGDDIAGKTLFVHSEQGLGDTLQFCRYLKLLEARGVHVRLAPQDSLKALLRTLSPTIDLVSFSDTMTGFDYHCYLASLPRLLGTTLGTIPADVPYLRADPKRVERWRERIGKGGFKIGISWQGSTAKVDVGRSFPVSLFAGLSRLPGVRLISLQKNEGAEQLGRLPPGMKVERLGEDFDAGPDAFLDSAAVMECLDLVISSDTAIAHLAGALARPAWLVLKRVPDWRWLQHRDDSPWYPTLRLFRQVALDDWATVFGSMERELAAMIDAPKSGATARPEVPISWGELIDKITILEIKRDKLAGAARANVVNELGLLMETARTCADTGGLAELKDELKSVNAELWEIEDKIREKEAVGTFDEEFVALARSVYKRNDRRAAIKRQINGLLASELVEEKLYRSY